MSTHYSAAAEIRMEEMDHTILGRGCDVHHLLLIRDFEVFSIILAAHIFCPSKLFVQLLHTLLTESIESRVVVFKFFKKVVFIVCVGFIWSSSVNESCHFVIEVRHINSTNRKT